MKVPGSLARLDEEQHTYLISLLSLGKHDGEIADAIQKEKGWLTDIKRETLVKTVSRWRKGKGNDAVLRNLADHMVHPNGRIKRQIDVVEELTALILKQKERIAKVAKNEDPTPMLMKLVTEEMRVLMQMLDRMAKLQLDTGILRRVRQGELAEDYADFTEVTEEEEEKPIFGPHELKLLELIKAGDVSALS